MPASSSTLIRIIENIQGPIMDDFRRDDGVGPSVVLGFASFFLSFAYFVFAITLSKYKSSIVYVAQASTGENETSRVAAAGSDFVHVENNRNAAVGSDFVQMRDVVPASERQMGALNYGIE